MQPADWNIALAPSVPWEKAYAAVEKAARLLLSGRPDADRIRTAELVEMLYPEQYARGDGILARKRIFKALAALETRGLADCATRSTTPVFLGRTKREIFPPLWHAPVLRTAKCPHCGGVL